MALDGWIDEQTEQEGNHTPHEGLIPSGLADQEVHTRKSITLQGFSWPVSRKLGVKYNIRMRTRLILGLWLLGILFPAIWLRQFFTGYRRVFDTLFGPEWMHIFMHLVLFSILGILLGMVFHLSFDRKGLFRLAVFILATGILQEAFQPLSQGISLFQSPILRAAGFDLVIDLAGGVLGLLIFHWISRIRISTVHQ
jgi:hypothetical protein